MNRIRATVEFEKEIKKRLSLAEYRRYSSFSERLEDNCYLGDTVGPFWLRETRLDGKRLYFFVDEPVVLFAAVSSKQNQHEVIKSLQVDLKRWKAVINALKAS